MPLQSIKLLHRSGRLWDVQLLSITTTGKEKKAKPLTCNQFNIYSRTEELDPKHDTKRQHYLKKALTRLLLQNEIVGLCVEIGTIGS